MAKRTFTIRRAWLLVLRAMAFFALTSTSLANESTYDSNATPRPRQPTQMFLTEFKLDPLATDATAIKLAVKEFINGLQINGHPPYHDDNVTLVT